jgi:preprotein translocase subunit YajC
MEWIFLVVIAGMFVLTSMSNRKRRRLALEMTEKLQAGATVILLGGIKGKISSINEDSIVVESTPGTRLEVLKSAIRSVEAAVEVAAAKPAKASPVKTVAKPAVAKKPVAKKPATKTATK